MKSLFKKSNPRYEGGIDHIMPGRIIGWVHSKNIVISEVRLVIGPHLISKASINIERKDVQKIFNIKQKSGFELNIPSEIPPLNEYKEIKIIAVNADCSKKIILQSLNKDFSLKDNLKNLFANPDLLGAIGHLDGVRNDEYIGGWCAAKNQIEEKIVWLRCESFRPIKLICDKERDDIAINGIKNNSGFKIFLDDLPYEWNGKEIWASFDEEGVYPLPKEGKVVVNLTRKIDENIQIITDNKIHSKIQGDYPQQLNYSESWEKLNEFKEFVNEMEIQLERYENALGEKNNNPSNLIKKMIKKLRY